MAEHRNALILKRGSIKAQVTHFIKYFSKIKDETNVNNANVLELENRLEKIELLWDVFNDLQTEIECCSTNVEEQFDERDRFQDIYFKHVTEAKVFLSKIPNETLNKSLSHSTSPESINSGGLQNVANIKLPTINLPSYDGTFIRWREFYDTFNALIHANSSISIIQKFCYLRASLKGEAASLIQSLETTENSYNIAWNLLKERYDNKRRIVHNHSKALLEIGQIQRESHVLLRQLINTVQTHLWSLASLGQPTEMWDAFLVPLIASKLDPITNKEWESRINSEQTSRDTIPTVNEIISFLTHKQDTLEAIATANPTQNSNKYKKESFSKTCASTTTIICPHCKGSHFIHACESFLKLKTELKLAEVQKMQLCINCLRPKHYSKNCKSGNCKICYQKHNTLLHIYPNDHNTRSIANSEGISSNIMPSTSTLNCLTKNSHFSQSLLSTACVTAQDRNRNKHSIKILLDSASQSNFITEELCHKLGLQKTKVNTSIIGINQTSSNIIYNTKINIASRLNEFSINISCLVLPKITENLPSVPFEASILNIPQNIQLADPTFNQNSKIDLLVGSNIFWSLLCIGQVQLGKDKPVLHKTKFGWIVAGNLNHKQIPTSAFSIKSMSYLSLELLDDKLTKFWQIDEFLNKKPHYTSEEIACEEHFNLETTRAANGRFIVKIPLKSNYHELGESKQSALKRFYSQERRLQQNFELKHKYTQFIHEYLNLNHMSKVDHTQESNLNFYLPHHAVIRESSVTTNLRVVFDGSIKSDTGLSLNDVQMTGPRIQNDLFTIITRFRKHTFVITADIAKMYRQIIIHPDNRNLQRIFWRDEPSDEISIFELNTVTYGTTSAPYLAIRCLFQLALENESKYPKESQIIKNDFYVDDLLTGADSEDSLVQIRENIITILESAGFHLRKWSSNTPRLQVDNEIRTISNDDVKALGICWNPSSDSFHYKMESIKHHSQITKRSILATTAQIFDPLGLLAPVTIVAKLLIQQLWQSKLNWDESIPVHLHSQWLAFRNQLENINHIEIPRHVLSKNTQKIELHGFSDASERGYGACIYIKTINNLQQHSIKLLAAKSRVAPLHNVTLPRLELCAAVLLANLVEKVREVMQINIDNQYLWSDSTITLCWIKASSSKWKTFVANRVAEIQKITNSNDWRHVRSQENPADLISRGILPDQLLHSKLWWNGPDWLLQNPSDWPVSSNHNIANIELPELRKISLVSNANTNVHENDIFTRISSLTKLKNVVAYCFRFVHNARVAKLNRLNGPITVTESLDALLVLIKLAQDHCFKDEIQALSKKKQLNSNSRLLALSPFLDNKNILRVGGRLRNSQYAYSKCHPIVLPPKHNLTKLIAIHEHKRLLHCGPQSLLNAMRESYWPISGRNLTRKIVRDCIVCFRVNPKIQNNLMGDLPLNRTIPSPPFYNCGVDYAGPFLTKDRRSRGYKTYKSYLCLFICFSTKAVHLEAVSDLTSECFLASLRRFISRRGKPLNMYSDNGTNFVGANSELKLLSEFLNNNENKNSITNSLRNDGISWNFIPPRSPHFGGLWEAGIKSTKSHLKRVIGNALLTFEDLCTVLTQIEAVLNSRPISSISNDPHDLNPLTPAHFIIGRSLTGLPDPDLLDVKETRLSHYQRLQQMVQHFWKRWSSEYINELQTRTKWKKSPLTVFKIGAMVLLKDDNLPPLKWRIGRITEVHAGKDGLIRVVSIKTQNNIVKRAITKLSVFPID